MKWMQRTGVILLLSVFCLLSMSYYAAADVIDDMVTQMQEIYGFMSEYDKDNISTARDELQEFAVTGTEEQWNTVLGIDTDNNLLTEEVITRFGSEEAARAAVQDIVTGLGNIYYSTDSEQLRNTLEDFKDEYNDEFQTFFGDDITLAQLYNLLSDAREALPGVISESSEAGLLARGNNDYLLAKMPEFLVEAMREAINKPDNQLFSGRLSAIGWSSEKLIAQQEALAGFIDADKKARISLALAAVRSETVLEAGPTTLQVGSQFPAVNEYTINIMGKDATKLVAWASADPSVINIGEDPDTGNFVIEAVASGTTELIVYRDYNDADPDYDWLYIIDVTVVPASSGGGGGGGGGLPGFAIRTSGTTAEMYNMVVDIPKGAVDEDTRGDIERLDGDEIDAPEDSVILGYIYEFSKEASGNFLKPVNIKLPYNKAAVDLDKYTISIYRFDEDADEWVELDNVKVYVSSINGETFKTGYFAVIATEKPVVPPVEPPVEPQPVLLTDISGHWAEAAIRSLVGMDAVAGYPDNTFRPDNSITRAEFATVLVKAFNLSGGQGKVFEDTAGHWAKDYIAAAYAAGIIQGYSDDRFGPDDLITREQMAVMIARASQLQASSGQLSFTDSSSVSSWAYGWVVSAVNNQLMSGYPDNTFRPQANATRAEAMTVIYNALN
jgi:hypothetical protein